MTAGSRAPRAERSVPIYLGLLAATVGLGLATRWTPTSFPDIVARYGGDALWAVMVVWLCALWRRTAPPLTIALSAIAISVAVELSQLNRAPWLRALRRTSLGALVLGQGFLWTDLLCYVVGVVCATALDAAIVRLASPRSTGSSSTPRSDGPPPGLVRRAVSADDVSRPRSRRAAR